MNTEAAAARKAPRRLFRGMGPIFVRPGSLARQSKGMSAFRQQDRSAGRRQGCGRTGAGRRVGGGVVQVCVRWMQRPVSASWNIIQYPLPSGAKRETGTYELYFFNGSGGLWRRSAGTP